MTAAIAETFTRDAHDPSVMVLDGHDLSLRVVKDDLILEDGMCGHRRARKLPRTARDIRRIVIIAHSGHVTLEAIKFIRDIGTNPNGTRKNEPISLVIVDPNGELLCSSARSISDNKLLRTQARVADHPSAAVAITQYLLSEKFIGRGSVFPDWNPDPWLRNLHAATTLDQCRSVEADESDAYWGRWAGLPINLTGRSIPDNWRYFATRRSDLNPSKNRNAADPINAMLNFCLGIAKSEITRQCHVNGLEPGLGIHHTDYDNANALTLDLVEAVRPNVEKYVLELIRSRTFSRDLFVREKTGRVRVLRPLTHELAEQAIYWHNDVKPVVNKVTTMIRESASGWQKPNRRQAGTAQKTGPKRKAALP